MKTYYVNQKELLARLDEFKSQGNELTERTRNITIYGIKLDEILTIINYAKEHGYKFNPPIPG